WIDKALNDSEELRDWVHIDDPKQLLGILRIVERQSLFSVIWQLVHNNGAMKTSLKIHADVDVLRTLGTQLEEPVSAETEEYFLSPKTEEAFQILLQIPLHSRQFNPTIWLELDKLGSYHTQVNKKTTRVLLEYHSTGGGDSHLERHSDDTSRASR
ncbi:MAG: hypothetical protein WBA28_01100, partial [Microbacteriaceae bacterium]